jgi:hypothetical protein
MKKWKPAEIYRIERHLANLPWWRIWMRLRLRRMLRGRKKLYKWLGVDC